MVQDIKFHQANFGGNFIGNPNVTGRLVIANPDPFACDTLTVTPDNQSYVGTVVLVRRGRCAFFTKAKNAQLAGAVAAFVIDCNPGAPSYCSRGRTPPSAPTIPDFDFSMPFGALSFEDGDLLFKYLELNPNTLVQVSIPGTPNTLTPASEKSALIAIAQKIEMPQSLVGGSNKGLKELLTNSSIDPCLTRVVGVICRYGHVASIELHESEIQGSVDPAINNLAQLESIILDMNAFQGTFPTINNLSKLKIFSIGSNQFKNLPTVLGSLPQLVIFSIHQNLISTLPSDLNYISSLKVIDIRENEIINCPISITSTLEYFDASFNKITAPFPNIPQSSSLKHFSIAYNQFESNNLVGIFDNIPTLTFISLASNKLQGPLPNFTNTNNIIDLDLSYNQFEGPIPETWDMSNVVSIILRHNNVTGPIRFSRFSNLASADLSENLIDDTGLGFGNPGDLIFRSFPQSIRKISLSGNKLNGDWEDMGFLVFMPALTSLDVSNNQIPAMPWDIFDNAQFITYFDLSYNKIQNSFPAGVPPVKYEYLNLKGNNIQNPSELKSIPSWASPTIKFVKDAFEQSYSCPDFVGTYIPVKLSLPPSFYNYSLCKCDSGYYGVAPDCQTIPPFASISTPQSYSVVSDESYGNNRFTPGIFTSWVVGNKNSKIKGVYVDLNIEKNSFNQFEDIIELYEGDESLSGKRIISFRGTDTIPFSNIPSKLNTQGQYVVFDSMATINFRSKKQSGKHLSANISVAYECPNNYLADPISGKCYKVFVINSGIQAAVYASSALAILFQIIIFAIVFIKRNTLVIKSASVPFCLTILSFEATLAISSIFYAISPEQGDWVCQIRPWLTAVSLIGALGALIVKVNRIRTIFNTKKLTVTVQTNEDLVMYLAIMIICEVAIMVGFQAAGLSQSTLTVGSKYTSEQIVHQCSSFGQNQSYSGWLAIQFIYIGVFMVAGCYIAWSIRKVPSAFNEAPQIATAFFTMFILTIILVPLNFIVDDNPDALVLIRGFGISLCSIMMTLFLFGPKLYYIIEGRSNDKSLSTLGTSMRSSTSGSSTSTSSSFGIEHRRGSNIGSTFMPSNISSESVQVAKLVLKATENVVDCLVSKFSKENFALDQDDSLTKSLLQLQSVSKTSAEFSAFDNVDPHSEEIKSIGSRIAQRIDVTKAIDSSQVNIDLPS